ncbi:MAG: pyridoxine 5'-phosphate synthase [Planctomycetota bacterium]|nr:pyridoxine 5'-phosphate synthase [Planctomycetota bacterium]MDA1179610.1 pyridoxine 5'-phosphate synthase [Planctomycetota bacterium]
MAHLGVNIDHVATLREARRGTEPDPVWAAVLAELGGADSITIHVREDRRHIQDRDLRILRETVHVPLNLELACEVNILQLACAALPEQATLVPEKREEITTEGGLDVLGSGPQVGDAISQLSSHGIFVSVFLDPDPRQIEASARLGAQAVELHTGQYALAEGSQQQKEWQRLSDCSKLITDLGLRLNAGHGLNYQNVGPIASLPDMYELNIGHSIVSRAVMVGMSQAVREMKEQIDKSLR